MSLINFFVPVNYNTKIKNIPQRALEAVDEYFYLGGKFRVTILAPNADHPQVWAMQNHLNCYRSQINTTIKVASYCTVVLPLIALLAKSVLRYYLQISSIRVEPCCEIGTKLSIEVLQHIASFLSYSDQARLAQVAHFARITVRGINDSDSMDSLKAEIEALPQNPPFSALTRNDVQRLLVELVTSRIAGHHKYWILVMDALMKRLVPDDDSINSLIQSHAVMAELLATSDRSISADQIYQFCRYLGLKQLSDIQPWIGYRVLEQYLLKPQLNFESVNKALREYLTQQAETYMKAVDRIRDVSNNRTLRYQEVDIDPRKWFGWNNINSSLWVQPDAQNGEIAPMPELLLEVLWTRIQSLRKSCEDRPFMVCMDSRQEAKLPRNFTLPLAQRIINADIFLDHHNTLSIENLEKQNYAYGIRYFNDEELDELDRLYPRALTIRE